MAANKGQLSHVQFFRVCEEMRNHEEWFKENKPSIKAAAKQLSEWCKFPVNDNATKGAIEATGITWEEQRKERKERKAGGVFNKNSMTLKCLRILTVSVRRLYAKLGEEIPEALELQMKELYPPSTNGPLNPK